MNWYERYIYAGLDAYNFDELKHKLKMFGIQFDGFPGGDHVAFRNPLTNQYTEIPYHKSINPATVKKHIIDKLNIPFGVWKSLSKKPKRKDMEKVRHLIPWFQKADAAQHNIDIGEPADVSYKDEPWYIEQEKARLQDEAETRELEEMMRQEELTKLRPAMGENKMNWYKIAWKDQIPGGNADKKKPSDYNRKNVERGKKIEFEHTDDPDTAREISMDHLEEHPDYYDSNHGLPNMEKELKKLEDTKPARRGRYPGQMQGDENRPSAGVMTDILNDNEIVEGKHVKILHRMMKEKDFTNFDIYIQKLKDEGHSQTRINSMMTRAMYGVKL